MNFINRFGIKLYLLVAASLFLLPVKIIYAQNQGNFNNSNWWLSYKRCNGYLDATVKFLNRDGDNDYMEDFTFYFVNNASNKQEILTLNFIETVGNGATAGANEIIINNLGSGTRYRYSFNKHGNTIDLSQDVSQQANDLHYLKIKWYNTPDYFFGNSNEFIINGFWNASGSGSESAILDDSFTKTVSIDAIPVPQTIDVSNDLCEAITIRWDFPPIGDGYGEIPNACTSGTWMARVERIYESNLAAVVFNGTINLNSGYGFVTDDETPELVEGETYNYRIRYSYQPDPQTGFINGEYSNPSTAFGNIAPDEPAPYLNPINELSCNGTITLNWQWLSDEEPVVFLIERNTGAGFNYLDSIVTDDQTTIREYVDNTPPKNQEVQYRIAGISCDTTKNSRQVRYSDTQSALAPGVPSTPANLNSALDATQNTIILQWPHVTDSIKGYKLVKTVSDQSTPEEIILEIDALNSTTDSIAFKNANIGFNKISGIISFTDTQLSICENHSYQVFSLSVNDCSQSQGSNLVTEFLGNTSPTLESNKFIVSKGFFGDRVELKWSFSGSNILDGYDILRSPLSGGIPDTIATITPDQRTYYDYTASAGEFYTYAIQGLQYCSDTLQRTNSVSEVGFTLPAGVISGKVTYQNGSPEEGVEILATPTANLNPGSSLSFNGNTRITVPASNTLQTGNANAFTIEMWIKPEASNSTYTIIKKHNGSNGYHLFADDNGLHLQINNTIVASNDTLPKSGLYQQVTASYDGTEVRLVVNGIIDNAVIIPFSETFNDINIPVEIGTSFIGQMDEVRIWNISKSLETIQFDYSRYAAKEETGLMAYWRMDEGYLDRVYDISKTGTSYHQNHGSIVNLSGWSSDIPNENLLTLKAKTNPAGNYIISNARYSSESTSYDVIPFVSGHKFCLTPLGSESECSPAKAVTLGASQTIKEDVNFTDYSSFEVSGSIQYLNTENRVPVNGCGSAAVYILVDGERVLDENGLYEVTDNLGTFSLQVPIGTHTLSLEREGHQFTTLNGSLESGTFEAPIYTSNFQDVVSGLQFWDTTQVVVTGRVAGGKTEGDLPPALGLSKNNIGIATVEFTHQANGCSIVETIKTDSITGEYVIKLPPLKFELTDVTIASNPALFTGGDLSQFGSIDLSVNRELQLSSSPGIDSVFEYHLKKNIIYRANPSMSITQPDGSPIVGENSIQIPDPADNNQSITISLENGNLPFEVFQSGNDYETLISLFEQYINNDNPQEVLVDKVPVTDARIVINNRMGSSSQDFIEVVNSTEVIQTDESFTGSIPYIFTANNPNFKEDELDATDNFTATFSATAFINTEAGEKTAEWPTSLPNNTFRAYVLGTKIIEGSSFITQGPELVDFILRDPPGGGSSAYLTEGGSYTKSITFSSVTTSSVNVDIAVQSGTDMSIIPGPTGGPTLKTKATFNNNTNFNLTTSLSTNNSLTESVSYSQTIATNTGTELVGAESDVYIGKSQNYGFGVTRNILMIPSDLCGINGVNCINENYVINQDGTNYTLGVTTGIAVAPTGIETTFIYTQNQIKTEVIPNLKDLRNNLFVKYQAEYINKVAQDHPEFDTFFASNNDAEVWGENKTSEDPYTTDMPADANGESYQWVVPATNGDVEPIDSIRWYNQQIRLWEEALARNEEEKVNALNNRASSLDRNISFDAGTSVSYSHTSSSQNSTDVNFEVAIGGGFKQTFENKVAGTGIQTDLGITLGTKVGGGLSQNEQISNGYGYSLADGNIGDFFSVDIYDGKGGNGPIFSLTGGQTMCPHEDEIISEYYSPGTVLSTATLRREVPTIEVENPIAVDVPSSIPASFVLKLGNESESDDTQWYGLMVDEITNPFGASLSIDGKSPNRVFEVPPGSQITKELKLTKSDSNSYENIRLIFYSTCEAGARTNGGQLTAADTIEISAFFVPSCTNVEILDPPGQWVVNADSENELPILVNNYDRDMEELNNIQLQYKPSNDPSWRLMETFFKNSDTPEVLPIPTDQDYISYVWDVSSLADGTYDIRPYSSCTINDFTGITFTGIIDRLRPHPFGNPQPADGVLDANDEIMIQFNEPIDGTKLNTNNFDIRGIINGTTISHQTSAAFDGQNNNITVPSGIRLTNTSFAIEMWVQKQSNTASTLIAQGTASNYWKIGFAANGTLRFSTPSETVNSNIAITDSDWHHIAVVYDNQSSTLQMLIDTELRGNEELNFNYEESESITLGAFGEAEHFTGKIHEVRIWDRFVNRAEIAEKYLSWLSGNELGLLANWPVDEGYGNLLREKVRNRSANLSGDWAIEPRGYAARFSGNEGYLSIDASEFPFSTQDDFTLEFWLNASTQSNTTLLSNGRGDEQNPAGWSITTSNNSLILQTGNQEFSVAEDVLDNNWHHIAIVVNRLANTNILLDGQFIKSINGEELGAFVSPTIWVGARGWFNGAVPQTDQYFNGRLDELRIWNTARTQQQVSRDMTSRLESDIFGMAAYFPFETYDAVAGIETLAPSFQGQSSQQVTAEVSGSPTLMNESANIKLTRPITRIPFTFTLNNDRIILTPAIAPSRIENVTLDISVKDVVDMQNNKMASTITWPAYINKNQVRWIESELEFSKKLEEPFSFTAHIENTGGTAQSFEMSNLPIWLMASPASGSIAPQTEQKINFTVNPGLNLGDYAVDLTLTNSQGFIDKLFIDLRVVATPPNWEVDPSDFSFSMNIVADLSITGTISYDPEDMVAAFADGEIRGVASPEYLPEYDRYELFMDVYANGTDTDSLTFQTWDASKGTIHGETWFRRPEEDLQRKLKFTQNTSIGTPSAPARFEATEAIYQEIALQAGSNWISFNVVPIVTTDMNMLLGSLNAETGDLIKVMKGANIDETSVYDSLTGWDGNMQIENEHMYKFFISNADTLRVLGLPINPLEKPFELTQNWNWISYLPQLNMEINEALATLNATEGDLIKSQNNFAVFDDRLGWLGSLKYMQADKGYMLHLANTGALTYPDRSILSNGRSTQSEETVLIPSNKEHTMNIIGKLQHTALSAYENPIIGAFIHNTLISVSAPQLVNDEWMYFLSIPGEKSEETIRFKLIDEQLEILMPLNESLNFAKNQLMGTISHPFEFIIRNWAPTQIYPNPFTNSFTISISLPSSQTLHMDITNLSGKELYSKTVEAEEGINTINWEAGTLQNGSYILTINGETTFKAIKLMKR